MMYLIINIEFYIWVSKFVSLLETRLRVGHIEKIECPYNELFFQGV